LLEARGVEQDTFRAEAVSGAGAKEVGVAGSLAVNVVHNTTEATLDATARLTYGLGAVTLTAQEASQGTATARPTEDGTTGSEVGVGASVAVHVAHNTTRAEVESGARLIGPATPNLRLNRVNLSAASTDAVDTLALGGTGATQAGNVAVTPVVAVTV